ncbi:VanZ family protein [Streptomyces sp. SID11385]|uniref:VanZ family protein n=1 Tax=Streptomyces sp. SID11385 TaxID=2706031 RepID=UPI0013C62682|nr:VanZ family protein [Streptomyces sp. SID11385]NEA39566.1 VanZ family protein [Streptomyces sp. SID11385]
MVVAFLLLVAFSAVLAKLTLTPSPASDGLAGSNLRPGHSLRQYAEEYTFLAACKQVGGNLLLGAPFGVLLPLLVPRRLRLVRVFVVTLLVMSLVELAQGAVIEGRAFDVDDVILNTAGALLGYAFLGRRLSRSLRRRTDPRPSRARRIRKPAAPWRATGPRQKSGPRPVTATEPRSLAKPAAAPAGPGRLARLRASTARVLPNRRGTEPKAEPKPKTGLSGPAA